MVEIRYGDQYEVADLAGMTVEEAREQFRAELGIPDRAAAKLNGSKVKGSAELDTVLNDDDNLAFAVTKRNLGAYLVGALLLALALTGGVFAVGFINGSATLTGATISNSNFADVSVNTTGFTAISWSGYGFFKGSVNSTYPGHSANGTPVFNIDTKTSGYTGDLVVSVTLGNADQLAKVYRLLALKLAMYDSNNTIMDINASGGAGDANDWVMLTLDNGSVSMFPKSTGNISTVRVKSGFYLTHVFPFGGWQGSAKPELFCEVAQR
jgi:hypothetical protein